MLLDMEQVLVYNPRQIPEGKETEVSLYVGQSYHPWPSGNSSSLQDQEVNYDIQTLYINYAPPESPPPTAGRYDTLQCCLREAKRQRR